MQNWEIGWYICYNKVDLILKRNLKNIIVYKKK
jgi:hypothetical protein